MLSITNSLLLMTALFNGGLAILILRGNWRPLTNRLLGVYLGFLSLWALALISTQIGSSYVVWLYAANTTYIAGLIIAASFYLFSINFPHDTKPTVLTFYWTYGLSLLFAVVLIFHPTFLIERIVSHDWGNGAALHVWPYLMFVALFVYLYIGGLIRIWAKYFSASGEVRLRLLIIGLGVTITGISGLYFDIILASPFVNQFKYIWSGPLFNTLMAVLIVYAVFRLRLFNVKVIITEFVVVLLWIFTLLRTFLAANQTEQLWNGGLFVLSLIIGYLLMRSVRAEVESREKIEKLAGELEVANRQQESLIHFISHEVKGALGKCSGVMSMILDGDYGSVPIQMTSAVKNGLNHTREAVEMLMTILLSSNLKSGAMKFNKTKFSLKKSANKVIDALKKEVDERDLHLSCDADAQSEYIVYGDENMLTTHVVRNLIDNAVRYTLRGNITVHLKEDARTITLSVKDSGVGLSDEDKSRLFTPGGHGKDSVKVNVNSTGYGLFFAKQLVEAHQGTIKAESEGRNKGSSFTITLPKV
jgi:signal transduction histidine kinase